MIFDITNPWVVGISTGVLVTVLAWFIHHFLLDRKKTRTGTLFSDEKLTDTAEHKSSYMNVDRLRHKNVSITLTHTGTINDYFVTVKFQSSETTNDADFRTIVEYEFEDDFENSFDIPDTRKYFGITAKADEGTNANYITIKSDLKALGD